MKTMMITDNSARIKTDIWGIRNEIFQTFLEDRLIVTLSEAIYIIELHQILYITADSNYSRIILKDGKTILSSKILKHFENTLLKKGFLRTHASYLVNLEYVTSICRSEGFCMKLIGDISIPISRAFRSQLFSKSLNH